jgi:hypothetical protein
MQNHDHSVDFRFIITLAKGMFDMQIDKKKKTKKRKIFFNDKKLWNKKQQHMFYMWMFFLFYFYYFFNQNFLLSVNILFENKN